MQLSPLVQPAKELSKDEISRYSRHLLIPDVGLEGQKRFKNSKVLVIGAGGLRVPITGLVDYQAFCGLKKSAEIQKNNVPVISALELKKMQENGTDLQLIDVRGIEEWNIVRIEGASHIPKNIIMSEDVLSGLNKDDFIVLQCKMGARSRDVLVEMQQQGFTNVKSLDGGIIAWIRDVDPSLPSY